MPHFRNKTKHSPGVFKKNWEVNGQNLGKMPVYRMVGEIFAVSCINLNRFILNVSFNLLQISEGEVGKIFQKAWAGKTLETVNCCAFLKRRLIGAC
jgi:hypothetical protein